MTDLSPEDRNTIMSTVYLVEQALRETLSPDKVNLAAFGNQVPHLHWHVIARWSDDRHFPDPVWAEPPPSSADQLAAWQARTHTVRQHLPQYRQRLLELLGQP